MDRIREILGLETYVTAELSADELGTDREAIREALAARDEFTVDELRQIIEFGKAIKTELEGRAVLDSDIAELTIPDPEPVEEATEEAVEEPVTVAQVARPAMSAPVPEPEAEVEEIPEAAVLVAAAGAPGDGPVNGPEIESVDQLGVLMQQAWKGTSPPSAGAMWNRVAQKQWTPDYQFEVGGSAENNYRTSRQVMRDAAEQARTQIHEGGVLQAATGICGPLTPRYTFFNPIDGNAGIIQLPEVALERGGIRIPAALTYDDLRDEDAIGGEYTSSDGDAGSLTKTCYEVECPDISDFEVAAYSLCLRFSNFAGQFFPEYVTDVTGAAQATHAHRVNRALIAAVVASADTVAYVSANEGGGSLVQFARNVIFHAGLYRDKYRLGQDAILEIVIPYRAYLSLLADLIARDSTTAATYLLDAWLADFQRQAGVRIQFVYDWEDMTEAAGDFGAEDYPFLVFPPGEVLHMTGGILDVGVVRDSTRNANNEFDLFSETFDGIAVNGYEIMSVTGMVLCPDGATGARVTIDCATVGS